MSESVILRTENHLHLYGCLSTEDLYELGADRYEKLSDRMEWFAAEYEKVFGFKPDYKSWWKSPRNASSQGLSGIDSFRTHFEFTKPASFAEFQAKFNLLIALNPPDPNNLELVKRVLTKDQSLASFREYRTFIPPYLSEANRESYLLALLKLTKDFMGGGFEPRIAFSILRDPATSKSLYEWLHSFSQRHPWTQDLITGIDFCGDEFYHPPSLKQSFMQAVRNDNRSRPRPWQVLYHVGEMWDRISLLSSARWVVEACQMGVKRIGHGMALGVDPKVLLGKTTKEFALEHTRHQVWMEAYADILDVYGYGKHDQLDLAKLTASQTQVDSDFHQITWTSELCEQVFLFQNALLKWVKDLDPVIEVCPTSNLRIGQLTTAAHHPLRRFLDAGIRVTTSTDDPGIFAIDLNSEERLLRRAFHVTDDELKQMEANALGTLSSRSC